MRAGKEYVVITNLLRSLERRFLRNRIRCRTVDEAIELFKKNPGAWLSYFQQPYPWPATCKSTAGFDAGLPNVCVQVDGHHIADMEIITVSGNTATIRHIGVASNLTGRGVGTTLVGAYARELAGRYGVECIIFSENSTEYHENGYERFFATIGARRLPVRRDQKADRPDFEWPKANW